MTAERHRQLIDSPHHDFLKHSLDKEDIQNEEQ
jgi:hypothetical protein